MKFSQEARETLRRIALAQGNVFMPDFTEPQKPGPMTKAQRKILQKFILKQGGRCAICQCKPISKFKSTNLLLDHDLLTDTVRGALCQFCRQGLSMFGESRVRVGRAIEYLTDHNLFIEIAQPFPRPKKKR